MISMLYDGNGNFSKEGLILLLLFIPVILISLTLHELAHGYAAYKCGDNTAKNFGRLTLNPISHLDIFGALMMLVVGFGWAKPVPINPRNFRKPRRDLFIVSIAGVTVNLILALIGVFLEFGCLYLTFLPQNVLLLLRNFFWIFSIANVSLAIFNLIPMPPLDGSKIISTLLPHRAAAKFLRIEQYSRYVFLAIILLRWLPEPFSIINDYMWMPFEWLIYNILNLFNWLANLVFRIY